MRSALGEGYAETLRQTYKEIPESSDFVMYWWNHAATLAREGKVKRFGFIATNSLRQTFNRRVLQSHLEAKNPLSLVFAIPDHPWVDSTDGAAVRISMTVGETGEHEGILKTVVKEEQDSGEGISVELAEHRGKIIADLTIGANVAAAYTLAMTNNICSRGVSLHGSGFIVTLKQARDIGLGKIQDIEKYFRQYFNGRDITNISRNVMVIDLFGMTEEEVRKKSPELYQWLFERVKIEREAKAGGTPDSIQYAKQWWLFGKSRPELRKALKGLSRYISTVETAKYRFFVFLHESILPDNMLVNIALDDAFYLGILSSRIHVTWALAAGGTLEDRPRYNKTRCFDTFPFPDCDEQKKARIRELGEQLDAHRKRQQALHPQLTITDMYNVLEKLRANVALNDKERLTHEAGLVSVLKQLHDELDVAVFAAYGWSAKLTDEEILEALVALNHERAEEERRGKIRWLRPEFQNPQGAAQTDLGINIEKPEVAASVKQEKLVWPKTLAEQARAVRNALVAQAGIVTAQQLARSFKSARAERVAELLQTLASLGQAREVEEGKFVA
jgi:hypothetical protein